MSIIIVVIKKASFLFPVEQKSGLILIVRPSGQQLLLTL
ncbi:hypothetical protein NUACC26_000120 [Scytonema sp. NUACC26]